MEHKQEHFSKRIFNELKRNPNTRKLINRFKAVQDKIIKLKSSITFLIRCRNTGIIPNFIINSTKNISTIFGNKVMYNIQRSVRKYMDDIHNKILRLTLQEKHELLKHFQSELTLIKFNLRKYMTVEDIEVFLNYETKLAYSFRTKINGIQKKKFDHLRNLQRREFNIKLNDKWFVNKTDIDIPTDVQWTLSLGHKHALAVQRQEFPTLKIISDGEDLIRTLEDNEEREMARTRFTTVIDNHLGKMRLSNRDRFMLNKVRETSKFLRNNRDLLILRADKGNTTVALTRQDYNTRMNNIIDKYRLLSKDPTSKLQGVNNKLVDELFRLNIITTIEKSKLKTYNATAPRLYGLPKIHKEDFPLRPICSFINSPSYGLCRYVTNILRRITAHSGYNVKNSLEFIKRIKGADIHNSERLVSFDVISLFPSIPIDLALSTIEEKWDLIEPYTKIKRPLFFRILKFCIEDNRYFQYDGNIYLQHEGLPMGSPASPVIADIVMDRLLDVCIGKLTVKPRLMTKYVDDLFCIISDEGISDMLDSLNGFCPFIKFTIENEVGFKLPYLDTLLIRKDKRIMIDWYQKPTSSGRILNYYSKHDKRIIINTANNLIGRVLRISDREFHKRNMERVRCILMDNNFPVNVINRLIRQSRDKYSKNCDVNYHTNRTDGDIGADNKRENNVIGTDGNVNNEKKEFIYKSMIYIPYLSERLRRSKIFDSDKYKMTYRSFNTIGKLFSRTKDRLEKWDRSNLVYKITCNGNDKEDCNGVYVGTTKNKLKTRMAGHKSDQKYRSINSQKTALSSHCCEKDHYPNFENVSILNTEINYKKRLMLEMLQIISVPTTQRINFKTDTEGLAQTYRHLIYKT